ncbi:helix-turn-helix domain-containing protein [Enterococcus villorum]|uniref:Aspartate aminotransferase n=2 Tax=Enterococcus villorum TaxID=112904 RepID=A0A511J6C4_9ENTE|nr:helix-turn-helix domain-containing protein [Enterococcus villorum]EOH94627.1 hypothetical protein UAO_00017 [Enterococcus villorum ATCC 700913]EOW77002.1 hypothetical protein I591_02323 [Enterococcus villorum ATCC 700913]GEL93239.1 aspartate aminotransferase [Enterococcus villorum]
MVTLEKYDKIMCTASKEGGEERFLKIEILNMMIKELSILEKNSERQVKLALLLGMKSMDCDTLTKQLNVTKKTLLSDIVFFNHTYSPVVVEIDQYQITTLKIPNDMNLEDLIKKILNHSTNVQILKTIFTEEPHLSKLAEKLYLSETSIRRIVLKMNTYFSQKKWPITIKIASHLQIIGNESFVRHFFCSMFREIYKPQQLPHFEYIFDLLRRYHKKKHTYTSISTYKLILNSYYFYTSIIRIGQAHLIEASFTQKETTSELTFFELLKKNTVLCSIIEKKYNFSLTKSNIQNLLNSYTHLYSFDSTNCELKQLAKLHKLVHSFYTYIGIDIPFSSEDIQRLNDCIHFNQRIQSFKITYSDILSETLMGESPQLLNAYEKSIEKAELTIIKENQLLYEELFLELITLSPKLITALLPYKEHFSILIVSYQEERILTFYKQLLLKKLPALHQIDIYQENIFSVDYKKINQYDLILTDIELNRTKISTHMLKISKIPTSSFWSNLKEIIYN